jgi:hypothetical protein
VWTDDRVGTTRSRIEAVAIRIDDPETGRLIRELAESTGESLSDATRRAVEA